MTTSVRIAAFVALAGASLASAAHAAPALEIRYYPERELRLHALNAQRGLVSALLQNAAVINRGDAPVTLDSLSLEFRAGDAVVQSNVVAGGALEAIAARSGRLAGSGMVQAFAFQFAPQKLLAGARPVGATTLAPGEALLIGARAFALQGTSVDVLRLSAAGHAADGTRVEGHADLPVSQRPLANHYVFPLAGNWYIGAGASFHSHHRWVVPEEFALDIGRLGEGGHTHRGSGEKNSDYYDWEAEVRAAADGKVVAVADQAVDSDEYLQRTGESAEAYAARTQQLQAALLAQGPQAIGGNVVVIEHAGGEYSHYAHLRHGSVLVKPGDVVKAGQPIAKLGNTGNSTEPHLHFQVTDGPDTLNSAGFPVTFDGIEILLADAPRELQTGDVVDAK